jgi:branched-subunit amino acid transport protein
MDAAGGEMTDLEVWITIFLLSLATALTRTTFTLLGHRIVIPPRIQEVLRYAPACALAAIIVPDLLMVHNAALNVDEVQLNFHNYKLVAGIAAIAFYWVKRDMLQMIMFGMLLFTALRVWFPLS